MLKQTSFYSIKDDVVNAGAKWVDKEVVVSGNIITSLIWSRFLNLVFIYLMCWVTFITDNKF